MALAETYWQELGRVWSRLQAGILATFLSLVMGIIMGFNTRFSQGLIGDH